MRVVLGFGILFMTGFMTVMANETHHIVTIVNKTSTEALLAKPGTYLGETFVFEQRHSVDVLVRVGVWEAGKGKSVIHNFSFTEYVLMISGRVVVTDSEGTARKFVAGDTFVIPKGWSGQWDVQERMKKRIVKIGDAGLLQSQ
jgi:uncharacterized protein